MKTATIRGSLSSATMHQQQTPPWPPLLELFGRRYYLSLGEATKQLEPSNQHQTLPTQLSLSKKKWSHAAGAATNRQLLLKTTSPKNNRRTQQPYLVKKKKKTRKLSNLNKCGGGDDDVRVCGHSNEGKRTRHRRKTSATPKL